MSNNLWQISKQDKETNTRKGFKEQLDLFYLENAWPIDWFFAYLKVNVKFTWWIGLEFVHSFTAETDQILPGTFSPILVQFIEHEHDLCMKWTVSGSKAGLIYNLRYFCLSVNYMDYC